MVCGPIANDEVAIEACPLPFKASEPRVVPGERQVPPSINVTVPSVTGLPPSGTSKFDLAMAPVSATLAVNVTDCPGVDGSGDEVNEVDVPTAGAESNDARMDPAP